VKKKKTVGKDRNYFAVAASLLRLGCPILGSAAISRCV
jgi:hypothetical protein